MGGPLTPETIEKRRRSPRRTPGPKSDHRGSAGYKRHMVHTFVVRAREGTTR
ncbi:hypothetical protein [Amycolatopsis sp. NBC_00355]|uniref:hypothetical protein n=1 Tax=Amycolatopsis sp. NBC_00355 TaxID=2975957 RepID=UPI003FA45522